MSSQILAIQQSLDAHPLLMPSPANSQAGFEREKKLEKVMKSYRSMTVLLQDALSAFSLNQSPKTAQEVLARIKKVREARHLFDFLGLLPAVAKRTLACHDELLLRAEAVAVEPEIEAQAPTPSVGHAEMERAIDLQAIFKRLKTSDHFCLEFCNASTKELARCYAHYKQACSEIDQNRIARIIHLFNELRDKVGDNWAFRLGYLPPHLWEHARSPLQLWEERFEPLMRFYVTVPDEQALRERANSFLARIMKLDASNSLPVTLLQYAYERVSTPAFSVGKEEWEGEDLIEYRAKVLQELLELIDFAKEPLVLPDPAKVPAALKVNRSACDMPRLALLQFAHETNRKLGDRLEFEIDSCMARFRSERLGRLVDQLERSNDESQATLAFLSRRFSKLFRLLLGPQDTPPFNPELLRPYFTNITAASLKNFLYEGHRDTEVVKISEKMLVNYLQTFANGHPGAAFIQRLASHKGAKEYFEGDARQSISERGARALLYAIGYLVPENGK